MKLILVPGSSPGSPLPSRTKIFAAGYDFHTKTSMERELTFARGAADAYGQQHTMHNGWCLRSAAHNAPPLDWE